MDHIVLREGENVTGVVCIDRQIGSCIILQASLDEIDKLLGIAQAQNVTNVTIIVPPESVEELKQKGWIVTNYVTMYHE